MVRSKIKRGVLLIVFLSSCTRASLRSELTEAEIQNTSNLDLISYYRGALLWEELMEKKPEVPWNLEYLMKGLQAASEGKNLPLKEEEIRKRVVELYDSYTQLEAENHLKEAERSLQRLANTCVELEPSKLYYEEKCLGKGDPISSKKAGLFKYKVSVLEKGIFKEIFSTENFAVEISLENTIPAFSKGVEKMREGGRRILYLHPSLILGQYPSFSNQLTIIDVELERVVDSNSSPLNGSLESRSSSYNSAHLNSTPALANRESTYNSRTRRAFVPLVDLPQSSSFEALDQTQPQEG